MMVIPRQCQTCKHFHQERRGNYCDAFPETPIPNEILDMRFDHRNAYPGDRGIRWEPRTPDTKNPFEDKWTL